jgi:hypothetical protein
LNAQLALCILRRFDILKGDALLLVQVPSGCKVKMEKIVMGKALFQRLMPREILGVDLLNSIQPIPPSNCFALLLLGTNGAEWQWIWGSLGIRAKNVITE